ncbi:zinc finger CCCH domain-containing protein 62, partial [Phtheirospermum japonicum]
FCVSDDDDDDYDDAPASKWVDSEEVNEDEDCVDKDDVESICNKIIQKILGKRDLQELKLIECKAFLRRHGLRLSGTKEECIERIEEHWRLKNGNGETLYPRSSFVINCTGDVCKGDVVLFNQKVYQSLNKRTSNKSICRRTVAGRIVKESYGAAKQQHTFTVEVLWSKGAKRLDPLSPLLVKGRNLYKMKTYRQHWKNEKERLEVLDEKHKRGAAARTIRAMRKTKAATKTQKPSAHKDFKRRKHNSHYLGPSRTQATIHEKNRELAKNKKRDPRLSSNHSRTSNWKQNSYRGHQNVIQSDRVGEPQKLPSQRFFHFQPGVPPREPYHFPCNNLPYSNSEMIPKWKEFSRGGYIDRGYSHSMSSHMSRNPDCFPRLMDEHTYRWR